MVTQKRTLGPIETRLLNQLAAGGRIVFSTAEARTALGDRGSKVNKVLYRLAQKGWLLRLEKSKYLLLPLEAGMDGLYSIHEFLIAAYLVEPYAIAYASALSYHALSDLVPDTVLVATTRRKREVVIEELGLRIQFVTIEPHKFFGSRPVIIEDQPVEITTASKTIVDGLDRPDLCGGLVEMVKGLSRYAADLPDWAELTADAMRLGNRTVLKRLGYLAELLDLDLGAWGERWRGEISPGETLLDPRYGRRGPFNGTWQLRLNVDRAQLLSWQRY